MLKISYQKNNNKDNDLEYSKWLLSTDKSPISAKIVLPRTRTLLLKFLTYASVVTGATSFDTNQWSEISELTEASVKDLVNQTLEERENKSKEVDNITNSSNGMNWLNQ